MLRTTQLPYAIRRKRGRGYVLEAKRDIKRGALILEEAPLLKLPSIPSDMIVHGHFLTENQPANCLETVRAAIKRMSHSQRAAMMELHGQQNDEVYKMTMNAFTHQIEQNGFDVTVACVYNNISRANHSCQPNAVVSWHEGKQRGMMHAIAPIRINEAIVVDYLADPEGCLCDSARRNAELQQHYEFTCDCVACRLPNGAINAADDVLRNGALQDFEISIGWCGYLLVRLMMTTKRPDKDRSAFWIDTSPG